MTILMHIMHFGLNSMDFTLAALLGMQDQTGNFVFIENGDWWHWSDCSWRSPTEYMRSAVTVRSQRILHGMHQLCGSLILFSKQFHSLILLVFSGSPCNYFTLVQMTEKVRLENRHLDIRSSYMQRNLRLRSKLVNNMRHFLCVKHGE